MMMKVFTLKMGTIQTGLLAGLGHRPLNKFPLKQGENNEGNHWFPEAEGTVFIHKTQNRNVAGEADDEEARQNQQEAASAPVPQNPELRLDPCSMNAPQPPCASVTSASRVCDRARARPLLRFCPYSP